MRMVLKIGALRGNISARHSVGLIEYEFGNHELGIRHYKIAAEAGMQPSLDCLKSNFTCSGNGKLPGREFISKKEMERINRAGHEVQDMVKSEEREKYLEEGEEWTC